MSPVFGAIEPVGFSRVDTRVIGLAARMQLQMHKYIWDPATRGV